MSQPIQQSTDEVKQDYMVFWSNEWATPPNFYWISTVEGESPKHALESNLDWAG